MWDTWPFCSYHHHAHLSTRQHFRLRWNTATLCATSLPHLLRIGLSHHWMDQQQATSGGGQCNSWYGVSPYTCCPVSSDVPPPALPGSGFMTTCQLHLVPSCNFSRIMAAWRKVCDIIKGHTNLHFYSSTALAFRISFPEFPEAPPTYLLCGCGQILNDFGWVNGLVAGRKCEGRPAM